MRSSESECQSQRRCMERVWCRIAFSIARLINSNGHTNTPYLAAQWWSGEERQRWVGAVVPV